MKAMMKGDDQVASIRGWTKPYTLFESGVKFSPEAVLCHFFENKISLCGRWGYIETAEFEKTTPTCVICRKMLERRNLPNGTEKRLT